ncbi:uncharacterized protein LOC110365650 isoform X3 [Columba livia]|uniref:uncharacterized protein LOC110365650 isoform X3 n=1 Tax=Columba livia TaxID=8932 RepID=UPI0031BBA3A0
MPLPGGGSHCTVFLTKEVTVLRKRLLSGVLYPFFILGIMEAVLAAPALEAGPVYFFDQMKTRKKERGKKIPEELSSYVTIDLPGFAPSPLEGRNAICAAPVVQNDAGQSPATISFSLSSNICEERGWISQLSESNSEDIDQKLPYVWTPERLEQIRNQIEERTSKLKEVGFDKPIKLRHYGDHREETFFKTWKGPTNVTVTPELTHGKPQIPVVKKADTAQRKLHYGLNDGSSFI